jgi:hypothetical protein
VRVAAIALLVASCASPVDLARKQRGDSPCARAAEKTCRKQLASADQQACIKREIYLCELREEESPEQSP